MINKFLNWYYSKQGWGSCCRCKTTWNRCKHHDTPISKSRGIFPLCEECWFKLTPKQRLPYYLHVINHKWSPNILTKEEFNQLVENVLAGL